MDDGRSPGDGRAAVFGLSGREDRAMPAHILREAERARVRFSYDADVVEALKVRIPSRYRRWDPVDKLWIVSEPWVSTVANLMTEHFGGHVTVDDRRPGHEPPPRAKASPGTDESDELRRLRRDLADTQRLLREANRRSTPTRGSSSADWAGELYRRLPAGMRDTVYKRLLTSLHPDANGGAAEAVELTKQLNGAFRAPKSGR